MTVKVTQDHILSGLKANSNRCPVALAISAKIGEEYDPRDVGVTDRYIRIGNTKITIPKIVKEFIERFDRPDRENTDGLASFEFEL